VDGVDSGHYSPADTNAPPGQGFQHVELLMDGLEFPAWHTICLNVTSSASGIDFLDVDGIVALPPGAELPRFPVVAAAATSLPAPTAPVVVALSSMTRQAATSTARLTPSTSIASTATPFASPSRAIPTSSAVNSAGSRFAVSLSSPSSSSTSIAASAGALEGSAPVHEPASGLRVPLAACVLQPFSSRTAR